MQQRRGIDGSPQDEACTNIGSCRTANSSSPSEEINVTPVPLFLVPWAVADAIRRHGRAVRVIHVRRTRNHQYAITVEGEGS